jgi:putative membrane protein
VTAADPPAERRRARASAERLADGEWHRLHPATPLLRGGIGLIAVIGIVIANLRERIIEGFFGGSRYDGDPFELLVEQGLLGIAALVLLGALVLFVGGFYLSWRFHTFRIGDEAVEVRSGVVFRTHRRARLDRVQGVGVSRSVIARLFGAAKLDISQAGQDGGVQLAYLGGRSADALREQILRRAAGVRDDVRRGDAADDAAGEPDGRGLAARRVDELLAPELDPAIARAESVVRIPAGRLLGSLVLSDALLVFVIVVAGLVTATVVTREPFALFGFIPTVLGLGGVLVRRFTRSLRYSIAATPDGMRVGFGLLATSNDTLPPGRIHSLAVSQSLLWRATGWWTIRVNVASRSRDASQQQQRSVVLPVGDLADVLRVVELALPGLGHADALRTGLVGSGGDDVFTVSPPRARVLRWFSRRRNGVALLPDALLLRRGAIWRELVVVPLPRVQSVETARGPLLRALRLGALQAHTVAGPISARIGALDETDAARVFDELGAAVVTAASSDRSHRWRSGESVAPGAA